MYKKVLHHLENGNHVDATLFYSSKDLGTMGIHRKVALVGGDE